MSEFNLINLGEKAIGPLADVINNLINKLSSATGWIFSTKGLKLAQEEAHKKIIDEIATRIDVDIVERRKLINLYGDFSKKNENLVKIVGKSFRSLHEDANPQDMSEDWIMDFFDKACKISDKGMQELWGNVLALEANSPNSFSKRLLHILFYMNYQDAENFLNFTRFCFYDYDNANLNPLIFLRENPGRYYASGITTDSLNEMENLGLVQCDYNIGFRFENEKSFKYQNKSITVKNDIIYAGNIKLTRIGQQLSKISEKRNHSSILESTVNEWVNKGYNVTVKRIG